MTFGLASTILLMVFKLTMSTMDAPILIYNTDVDVNSARQFIRASSLPEDVKDSMDSMFNAKSSRMDISMCFKPEKCSCALLNRREKELVRVCNGNTVYTFGYFEEAKCLCCYVSSPAYDSVYDRMLVNKTGPEWFIKSDHKSCHNNRTANFSEANEHVVQVSVANEIINVSICNSKNRKKYDEHKNNTVKGVDIFFTSQECDKPNGFQLKEKNMTDEVNRITFTFKKFQDSVNASVYNISKVFSLLDHTPDTVTENGKTSTPEEFFSENPINLMEDPEVAASTMIPLKVFGIVAGVAIFVLIVLASVLYYKGNRTYRGNGE